MFKLKDDQVRVSNQILELLDRGYKNIFLCAPTGWGKSGIAYTLHKKGRERDGLWKSLILNQQKVLVDQYDRFLGGENGVLSIKGKDNYLCPITGDPVSSSFCQVGSGECSEKDECEYFKKRRMFEKKEVAITNYQFVFSLHDIDAWKRESSLCILDECHNIESIFTGYREVYLNRESRETYSRIQNRVNKHYDLQNIDRYFNQVQHLLDQIGKEEGLTLLKKTFSNLKSLITEMDRVVSPELSKLYRKAQGDSVQISRFLANEKRKLCKWENYLENRNQKWVLEEDPDGGILKLIPLRINNMLPSILNSLGQYRVFMSATILDAQKMSRDLGLDPEETTIIDLPSSFPVENRRVFFLDEVVLNYKTSKRGSSEIEKTQSIIKDVCSEHSGQSGYIYAPSYYLCKMLRDSVGGWLEKEGWTVLMNTSSEESNEILERFQNEKDTILFSPSFSEGVNFIDDVSRFQILVKCPYLSLGSRYVKERCGVDRKWYELSALTSILQVSGRSVRHENDYATTYVLDKNSASLMKKYWSLVPEWYKEQSFLKNKYILK